MPQAMTHEEWKAEATRRFGSDPLNWRFVCPSCGHVASVKDWRNANAPEGAVAFSCVGRFIENAGDVAKKAFKRNGGPCNYTGGGLFALNPIQVDLGDGNKPLSVFAFDDDSISVDQTKP